MKDKTEIKLARRHESTRHDISLVPSYRRRLPNSPSKVPTNPAHVARNLPEVFKLNNRVIDGQRLDYVGCKFLRTLPSSYLISSHPKL